jgi:hypothetical protein
MFTAVFHKKKHPDYSEAVRKGVVVQNIFVSYFIAKSIQLDY